MTFLHRSLICYIYALYCTLDLGYALIFIFYRSLEPRHEAPSSFIPIIMGFSPASIVDLQVIMIILSVLAVSLRFWSRALFFERKQSSPMSRFWWDDWLALADLVRLAKKSSGPLIFMLTNLWPFVIATCSINIYWVSYGLGTHYDTLSSYEQAIASKLLFAEYFPYDVGISLTKLSVIFFYVRVFKVNREFRIGLWLTASLVIGWIFFALFSALFQCKPISKSWLPLEPGTCINTYQWWLASAISSLIIDFIILMLPVPMLLNLQLQRSRKILILIVFAFGYSVIGVTIGRLVVVTKYGHALNEDLTYNIVVLGVWLTIEGPIGLITISLPSIFSLVRRGMAHGPLSLFSTKDLSNSNNSESVNKNSLRGERGFKQLNTSATEHGQELPYSYDPDVEYQALALRATSSTSRDRAFNDLEAPKSVIYIRRDVDVV
ncbi:e147b13e-ce82-4cc9-8935-6b00fdbc5a0d [Sclerotinia trifoliorum]|uniref:E147b13e-ce82-4cc9-8935-6b00fdbc5a0d n=1 Tax=Sclerotinia trifoliorum TaxID=28548 RepID=A0A8H2VPH2_9HELO|nr:e147b13e-ce82-4cc9-8935-6b00fdbc5a0d [Sclerotinia trifoliorum]